MKIVSLLPSATEICFALGLEDQLEAVTFECDFPPGAREKPHATTRAMPEIDDPAEVDRLVRESMEAGAPIYRLDDELVRRIDPDLVLAQDLCRVCAVPSGHVQEALDRIGGRADVISLDPSGLDDVIACISQVGRVAGVPERAAELTGALRSRLSAVQATVESAPRLPVLTLEWSEPAFVGGHWVPEMVRSAGGHDVLGAAGERSRVVDWSQVGAAQFDVAVFMPCGYDLRAAVEEGQALVERAELSGSSRIYAVDASAYFSRPGPRLVDGVEMLAWALHPSLFAEPPPGRISRLR